MDPLLSVIIMVLLSGGAVILLAPVSLRFDSIDRSICVRWLGLSLKKRWGEVRPKARGIQLPPTPGKWLLQSMGQLLLTDRTLFLELSQQVLRSTFHMMRSISIREITATFSTPDPMVNGVLWGIAAGLHHQRITLTTNFENTNRVEACFQIQPYAAVRVVIALFIGLPYGRIILSFIRAKKRRRKEESS